MVHVNAESRASVACVRQVRPVNAEGETLQLKIEDVGNQGDGLGRVGPGYVVLVPDTEIGQQPLVRITTVREDVAFAEVLEQ